MSTYERNTHTHTQRVQEAKRGNQCILDNLSNGLIVKVE